MGKMETEALIVKAIDERDAQWKRAIGEVLKDNPEVAKDFLEALAKSRTLRQALNH